ncbi:MAG: PAS domain S-box protein [Methylococcales bacterium]
MSCENLLNSLIKSISQPVWLKDTHQSYIACNSAFEQLIGLQEINILGKTDHDLADVWRAELVGDELTGTAFDAKVVEKTVMAAGQRINLQIRKTPFFDQQGQLIGVFGMVNDVTEFNRQQGLLKASNTTLEKIITGQPLAQILTGIVLHIEAQSPEMRCSILLLTEDGQYLQHGAAPSLPDAFNKAIDGAAIGLARGSCGTAAYTGQPVFVDDISSHPFWQDFVELAMTHNLGACWSTPILSGQGSVLGTFAVYYQTPRTATQVDRELIANATYLAAVAIERHQNLTKLQQQLEELKRWQDAMLEREVRTLDYKKEINDLLKQLGQSPRYAEALDKEDSPQSQQFSDLYEAGQPLKEDQLRQVFLSVIEDQKAIEEQLKKTNENLELAEAFAKLGSWNLKAGATSGAWSKQMFRHFNLDPTADAPSVSEFLQMIHPDDQHIVAAAIQQMTVGHLPKNAIYRRHPNLGELRYFSSTWKFLSKDRDQPQQFAGTVLDITESQLTEQALIESELRFRNLANNGHALIWTARVDKKCDYFNKTWLEFTGRSLQQEWGHGWTEGVHPDDYSRCFEIYEHAFDLREQFSMIYRLRRFDGEYRWIIDDGVPQYNQAGQFIGYLGYCLDITERIQAENALQELNATLEQRVHSRTAELVQANQELESFSYSVSHDLRAPLRAITGFAQILVRRHRQHLNAEGQHYLDNVVLAGERMGKLIDDLLLYSRTGRVAINNSKVNFAALLAHISMTFAKRIEKIGAAIMIMQPLAEPMGDVTLLSQIMSNLIENALTYHSTTQTPCIRIYSSQEHDKIVIRVCDNGIGIAAEYQDKVFQVFQRLHTDEEYPGTGIGLAIVSKAARLMGGAISVESMLGQGCTFTLILPAPGGE